MSKMIQVRNVPDVLHRKLKIRAAEQGVSLSDFILTELKRVSEQMSPQELAVRSLAIADAAERDGRAKPAYSVADLIREEREARERHLGAVSINEPRPRGRRGR